MALYKQPKPIPRTPPSPIEKHFHDHDETWVIMGGRAQAFMVDREGEYREFELEKGDIWMIEAGVEHGYNEPTADFLNFPFPGSMPEGSHTPGHYYMEEEGYMPTLRVTKTPIDRYTKSEA
jgi:hypothetical protein